MMKRCLSLSLFLLFLTSPLGAQTSDIQKVRIADFSGGQNSNDFFDKLKENEAHLVENLEISNKGQAKTRKGQALFLTDVGSTAFSGLGAYYQDATTSYILVASGTSVYRNTTNDWTKISGVSSLGSGNDTGFIQANNSLFVFNGSANTSWWDGNNWFSGGTWPTSPPTATTATWLNNYLFLAGNATNTDWVYVSNNLFPASFPAVNLVRINTGDGQSIKKLEAYSANGQSKVITYKERSIFDLDISNVDSTCSPQPICQWNVSPISKDVGTPAPRSVVNIGSDQWFLSSAPFAVRALSKTQFDRILVDIKSRPIQDIFNGTGDVTLNTVQVGKAAAVLFDNKYFLAIPTASSSVNNFVVVYDFLTQSWYEITGWYPKDWLVYQNNLYYTDANDGRVLKCLQGTVGDFGSVTSGSQPSVAINSDYESRGIDFGYPENFKALDSVGVEFFPTGNYDATVSINLDNSGWQTIGTVNLSGDALTLPFTLPATITGEGLAIKTVQAQRYGEFKRIQGRVTLNTASETTVIQALNIFGRIKPWRREQ